MAAAPDAVRADPGPTVIRRSADDPWSRAFQEHHHDLVRLATFLCGDSGQAEDAVADVFVSVHDRFDSILDVGPFLRRSVVNRLHDGHRRRVVRQRPLASVPTHPDPVIEAALQTDEQRAVWAAVQRLPERQRACVVLRYYADLPEADIAATLDISRTTVNTHLERARTELARILEDLR